MTREKLIEEARETAQRLHERTGLDRDAPYEAKVLRSCADALEATRDGEDPNVTTVVARLQERSRKGIKEYGYTTAKAGLSQADWLRHLQDELLDGAVYVQAALATREDGSERRFKCGKCGSSHPELCYETACPFEKVEAGTREDGAELGNEACALVFCGYNRRRFEQFGCAASDCPFKAGATEQKRAATCEVCNPQFNLTDAVAICRRDDCPFREDPTAVNPDDLEAGAHDMEAGCKTCDGTGTVYTVADETELGCSPGSSGIDCPDCAPAFKRKTPRRQMGDVGDEAHQDCYQYGKREWSAPKVGELELRYHAAMPNWCKLVGLEIRTVPECEGGGFMIQKDQAEHIARSLEREKALGEAQDPDMLDTIADEIDCHEHSARAHSLRVIAKQQRAALAKARGEWMTTECTRPPNRDVSTGDNRTDSARSAGRVGMPAGLGGRSIPKGVSDNIVIMTHPELIELLDKEFQRGVRRGEYEALTKARGEK